MKDGSKKPTDKAVPSAPAPVARKAGFARTAARFGLAALLFLAAFWVFDRLLFSLLRASALGYYRSLVAEGTLGLERRAIYGQGESDLLYFGTSRARHALDLPLLAARLKMRAIREAEIGHFPRYSYYFYERYRRGRRKPGLIVYGLDYFMFEKRTLPKDLAGLGIRIDDESMNPRTGKNPSSPLLSRASRLYRLKPEIDTYLTQAMNFGANFQPQDDDGLDPKWLRSKRRNRNPNGPTGPDDVRPDHFSKRAYTRFPGIEGEYLERLLVQFESEGIPVVFLLIPDYVATNETNFEQAKFKEDVRRLAARHANIRVLDFNAPARFDSNKRAFFLDGRWGSTNCHLSPKGTAELTRRVLPELRRILVRTDRAQTLTPRQ